MNFDSESLGFEDGGFEMSQTLKNKQEENIQDIAKQIKELDFKNQASTKVIKRIEREFNKANNNKKDNQSEILNKTLQSYHQYLQNKQKQQHIQYFLLSFGLTTGFLISRVPNLHRFLRLGAYIGLGFSMYEIQQYSKIYFVEQNFQQISLKHYTPKELKKLYRAYQIKKSEIEEDKKALAKYKFDPQSYH